MAEVEILNGKLLIDIPNHDIAVAGFETAIDDSDITIEDTGFNHRIAFNFSIESRFGIADEVTIKIQTIMQIVFGWRGKTRLETWSKL